MKKMLVAAALVLLVLYLVPIATMLGKQTALDLTLHRLMGESRALGRATHGQ
jgi:hypothetical protein